MKCVRLVTLCAEVFFVTHDSFDRPAMDVYPAHPTLTPRRADRRTAAMEDGAEPLPASRHMQTHFDARPSIAQTLAVRTGDAQQLGC